MLGKWQVRATVLLFMMGFGALHEIMEYMSYLMLGEERGMLKPGELAAMVERVAAREIDPYTAADELLALGLTRAEGL